jgi:hypothetical protein
MAHSFLQLWWKRYESNVPYWGSIFGMGMLKPIACPVRVKCLASIVQKLRGLIRRSKQLLLKEGVNFSSLAQCFAI